MPSAGPVQIRSRPRQRPGWSLERSTRDHGPFRVIDGPEETGTSPKDVLAARLPLGGIDATMTVFHRDDPALDAPLNSIPAGVEPANPGRVEDGITDSIERRRAMARDLEQLPADCLGRNTPPGDLGSLPKSGSVEVVQIRHGLGASRSTLADKEVVATPGFHDPHEIGRDPACVAREGTSFDALTRREHGDMKASNEDCTTIFVPEPGRRRAA